MSSLIPALHPATVAQVDDLATYLHAAASAGFRAADFNMPHARALETAAGRDAVIEAFQSRGIQPGAWGAGAQVIGTHADFDASLDEVAVNAALGAALGARVAAVVVPNRVDRPRDEMLDLLALRIGDVADTAAGEGVALSLEFIGPNIWPEQPYELFSGIRGTLDLIDRIGRVNVGILFDTYHFHCGDSELADIATAGRAINHVHLNDAPPGDPTTFDDSVRRLPGEGVMDLPAIAAELEAAGYAGPGGVEIFNDDLRALPLMEGAARVAAACRRVFGQH
ncbi:MAG: sugar phosphate isomerase/epimerase [Chloroflexota bacterium]|nr:sugar phosphate isomerase/epimerase [Chloroflexota bacterium]MDE2918389.1 sugar phosphate isomerase/epimerase [Chloroflexota bacterium]